MGPDGLKMAVYAVLIGARYEPCNVYAKNYAGTNNNKLFHDSNFPEAEPELFSNIFHELKPKIFNSTMSPLKSWYRDFSFY